MDNAQLAILIGVGLLITLSLATVILSVTGIGNEMLGTATKQLSTEERVAQQELILKYKGSVLSGNEIRSLTKQYHNSSKYAYVVFHGNNIVGRGGYASIFLGSTAPINSTGELRPIRIDMFNSSNNMKTKIYEYTEPSSTSYIYPKDNYKSYVIVDDGGVLVGFCFVKQ